MLFGVRFTKVVGSSFDRQDETKQRRESDENNSRGSAIRESMMKLERTLNSEIKRRVETNKAIQATFESQIAAAKEKFETTFCERLDQMESCVESLNQRMTNIEEDFELERDKYVQNIEEKNAIVSKELTALHNSYEYDKLARSEREATAAKRMSDYEFSTDARLEQEKVLREQKYAELRQELDDAKSLREKGDEKFQSFILEEVAALKNGLLKETQTREQADDDIVHALNHYTRSLQESLRVVNQP